MGLFFWRRKVKFDPRHLPPFLATLEETDDLIIVRFRGAIDRNILPEGRKVREALTSRPGFRMKNILYDFKLATAIDSATVAQLIEVFAELKKIHHRMGIINLKSEFRSELEILRVARYLTEYPSEKEALKALAGCV
jgi:anti-anti-sigma regulatory factor